jgi:hypothetical protein
MQLSDCPEFDRFPKGPERFDRRGALGLGLVDLHVNRFFRIFGVLPHSRCKHCIA